MVSENLDQDQSKQSEILASEEGKCSVLKQLIHQKCDPAFLCQINPENPHFLEIIECNKVFLDLFDLTRIEVIGNNYDFLLQNEGADHEMYNYFEYSNLIKAVKSLQVADIKISIPYPKNKNKIDKFQVSFVPSRYNTANIYCIFTFKKLDPLSYDNKNDIPDSAALVQNLERVVRNERLLRGISDFIASDSDLKKVAEGVAQTICEHLKVDRCILYDCEDDNSGFLVEYCTDGVKKISDSGDFFDPNSPTAKYLNFQNKLFLEINHLKQTTTMMIFEDIVNDDGFEPIRDVCHDFGIGSQIVVMMASNGLISGGFYIQQSSRRNWLLEEGELISIVASQFSMAIERENFTHRLVISNQSLVEKSEQLEKSLTQEKKMRELQSEFVALVSHEFKTPLQIIDGARELVSRKIKSNNVADEDIDRSLNRIKNAIVRMNNLIQSNLNLSKIEIGEEGIKINKQDFDIKDLINDIVEKNFNLALEKNIKIEIDIDKLPPSYDGDHKLLNHSFSNIITNAIKYSKKDSVVKIFGDVVENKLSLKVIDTGIGIPKEDLERIGTKFFRAQNTLSVAGTGIGLYLTKHFIELHSGSVAIESELNVGSTITAFLPIT